MVTVAEPWQVLATALLPCAVSALFVWWSVGRLMPWLINRHMLDKPNSRSSHQVPVPRGGGLAFLPPLFLGLAFATALSGWRLSAIFTLLAVFGLLAAISWLDDRIDLSASIRLPCHLLCALLVLVSAPALLPAVPFWPWLAIPVLGVGWAYFMNAYNFMDGIDGITGVETASIAIGGIVAALLLPLPAGAAMAVAALSGVLIGISAGFLIWNWPPARLFCGDVGSVALGFCVALLLLLLASNGFLAASVVLAAYYLVDSTSTIVLRLWRRENIFAAHRAHAYQRASSKWGHRKTILFIGALNAVLILIMLASVPYPALAILGGLGLCLAATVFMRWTAAGAA